MQTRFQSLIESVLNVVIGYGAALGTQLVVFPMMGIAIRFNDNLKIGAIFTVVSICRSYTVRRFFNWLHK